MMLAYIDIKGLEAQIQKLKTKIHKGIVEDGYKAVAPQLEDVMSYYMWKVVYKPYDPVEYDRTYKLLNSIKSRVDGNYLYIYSDGSNLDRIYNGLPYSFRVLYGDKTYDYDYPKEGAYFMQERDWIGATADEIVKHAKQAKWITEPIAKAVKRRIKR